MCIIKILSKQLSHPQRPVVGKWACRLPTVYEADGDAQLTIESCEEFTLQWGQPHEIGDDSQRSASVIAKMVGATRLERHRILVWLMPSIDSIACTRQGCLVAQKAVELALGDDRKALLTELQPHVTKLYNSPFGNFVLSKVVETMPSAMLDSILEEFQGRVSTVARHRYGCRILERLIEHCTEHQMSELLDEIVADAESLSQHCYGNFVVQRVLEHGAPARSSEIVRLICVCAAAMAQHRFGSHVVGCALGSADKAGQEMLVGALLAGCDLVAVACNRFGVLVVERLADLHTSRDVVKQHLSGGLHVLEASRFGKRAVEAFNLAAAIERDNFE